MLFIVRYFLLVVAAMLFSFSASAAGNPKVTWSQPKVVVETIVGETAFISTSVVFSEDVELLDFWVVPELQQYIAVSPAIISSAQAGVEIPVNIAVTSSASSLPMSLEGTVHVRDGTATLARPLSIELDLIWESIEGIGGNVAISIPGGLVAQEGGDFVVVGDEERLAAGLPPEFSITVFNVPEELSMQPPEIALAESVLMSGLESGDIELQEIRDGGLLVLAKSFTQQHFFVYDSTTHKCVQFLSGVGGYFDSTEFDVVLRSLTF